MNNSKGKMEKQNGHVSRERGSGRGAAGSVVQAEGQGGGEQTRTDSMGQACSSGVGLRPPSGPWAGAVLGHRFLPRALVQALPAARGRVELSRGPRNRVGPVSTARLFFLATRGSS